MMSTSTAIFTTGASVMANKANLSPSHQHIGAIVGGVLGGVFVLAFAIFALFLVRRRQSLPIPVEEIPCAKVNYDPPRQSVSEPVKIPLRYADEQTDGQPQEAGLASPR
jgi:hypothetical protein